ncbi:MAG: protein phosphatase 2C domain-containing protein [Myxococcota bacterium]|nr:protein phosphatase 2C domain-containing protein [Myxococcota bacterium]
MSRGVLRGAEAVQVGRIATICEGAAAIALSRGGAAKTYSYVDPNEDCVGFARGPAGVLLAVGDAHNGREASQVAVETVLERFGESWTAAGSPAGAWSELASEAVVTAHEAVLAAAVGRSHVHSRTTLAFALLRPGDGWLGWGSLGDSHVFRVTDDGVEELGAGRDEASWFVGSAPRSPEELGGRARSGRAPASGTRAVVLASDGLSERRIGVEDPAAAVAEAVRAAEAAGPELRPLAVARGLVEIAQAAQQRNRAGDNIAAAVAWPP